MTFAIPHGRRVFLSNSTGHTRDSETSVHPEPTASKADEVEINKPEDTKEETTSDGNEAKEIEMSNKRKSDAGPSDAEPAQKRHRGQSPHVENAGACDQEATPKSECKNSDTAAESNEWPPAGEYTTAAATEEANTSTESKNDDQAMVEMPPPANPTEPSVKETTEPAPASIPEQHDDIIVSGITGLNALATKIAQIDGRVEKLPNGNAWKEFRAYRNNQDMGSLWEVRQAWFLRTQ